MDSADRQGAQLLRAADRSAPVPRGRAAAAGPTGPGREREHRCAPVRRPAGRAHAREDRPGPGAGEGLRLADHPGQAAVLAAGKAAWLPGQLGLVDHRADGADQAGVLPAVGGKLQVHGQDEGPAAAHDRDPRALQERPAEDEPGDDGPVPHREGQPARRLPADRDPDPGVHRAVLGAAVVGRNARRAVAGLDQGPVSAGSVLHPADRDGRVDVRADQAEPDAAGSGAGQGHDDHAAGVLGDVLLLPGRPGAVLGGEQHPVDRAAVADQPDAGQGQDGRGGQELSLLQDAVMESPAEMPGFLFFPDRWPVPATGLLLSHARGRGEPGSSGVGYGWSALATAGVSY
ncbi:hypothetical protein CBM2599_A10263 [Cupriavidus taiwanensis]|nr:hypothetical protein CBM2599_A10263 [Cupriavidus taiwanensis]SOY80427.1 hypothetical protein CBM2600_A10104 [Cupriavidus taiwanensis]